MKNRHVLKVTMMLLIISFVLCGCGKGEDTALRVGALKGPTSMGLLFMQQDENYDFTMATAADELLPMMIKGELDIALLPANVAAILYQKTEGQITAIDINTLGVLYLVSGSESIKSPADLKGKTVYLTGRGTTPDYVLHYILEKNGLTEADVELEFKSEPAEVAALLSENPDSVGLLPQPFVTAAQLQNDKLKIVMNLNEQWDVLQGDSGSRLVTGVTVVRNDVLKENKKAVLSFIEDHAKSVEAINADPDKGAVLAVEAGIVAKEPIAKKAIPFCNIVSIRGEEMKQALSGYLQVLYEQNEDAVGGKLPSEEFYFAE